MRSGEIFKHEAFYRDAESGERLPKYLVVLARTPADDIVARLLTSRAHGRPESPLCFHGAPYPSFYLGVLGDPLSAKSWVDLRALDDIDAVEFGRRRTKGIITYVTALGRETNVQLLDCAASADDTTRMQEKAIRDALASLH